MQKTATLEDVLTLTKLLSPFDRVMLIQNLAQQVKRDLILTRPKPRPSLRGAWKGINIRAEEITELRSEMWKNFPREDI